MARRMLRFVNAVVVIVVLTLGVMGAFGAGKPAGKKATSTSRKTTAKRTPAKRSFARSAPAKKPAAKRAPVRSSAASSKKKTSTAARRGTARRTVSSRRRSRSRHYTRVGQQKPQPERILEIEQALAQQGFLPAPPDSVWDAHSTEAMRRFQAHNHITSDGKLNALSIIALGLGPKRGQSTPSLAAAGPATPSPSGDSASGAASPQ